MELITPLVQGLKTSQMLLHRFVDDLTPEQMLHRICDKANCAAWIVGHLIQTERSMLGRLGVTDLPELPDGFEDNYGRSEDAALKPDFGDTANLMSMWDELRNKSIAAVEKLDAETLAKPLEKPHPLFADIAGLISFVGGQHVAMHAGQITFIRRDLGMPPVI